MPTTEPVRFSDLRQLLLDLGFREVRVPGSYIAFEHAASGALFTYPEYRPEDLVHPVYVSVARKHLDERGILDEKDFDRRWRKVSA